MGGGEPTPDHQRHLVCPLATSCLLTLLTCLAKAYRHISKRARSLVVIKSKSKGDG